MAAEEEGHEDVGRASALVQAFERKLEAQQTAAATAQSALTAERELTASLQDCLQDAEGRLQHATEMLDHQRSCWEV